MAAALLLASPGAVADACSTDTLSAVLLSPSAPTELFANPNGNPLTSEETDEIRKSLGKVRSTLGPLTSLVSVRSPHLPRSLEITVGANARAAGYVFSPKAFAARAEKAGEVVISFGTDARSPQCRIFWVRISIPAGNAGTLYPHARPGA